VKTSTLRSTKAISILILEGARHRNGGGRHGKTFESVLGPLHLQRAYYHCERCESGFCPRDRALRLESFSLTPGVLRMTASAAALLSFEESSGLLHELAGAEVSAKQVERAAEALGAEIAVDEHQQVEMMGEVAPTMYLGMDGTGVPMRTPEVADRAGEQADGSAKTREAKLVTIWTAESRDEEGQPVRDPGSITYSAAIESAAALDQSRPLGLRGPRTARGQPSWFHRSSASGGAGRWLSLDLELGYGTIPASHSDSRPLSCQRTS
jgi:hypothetical protein